MDDQSLNKAEELMDFSALVNEIVKTSGLTKQQVQLVLKGFSATVAAGLKEGKTVRVARFGTFRVKDTPSPITPKRIVFFAAKDMKDLSIG
jgi:nucleoid DNA-binding protein